MMMLAFVGELMPRVPALLACWFYSGAIGAAAVYGDGAPAPVRVLIALLSIAAASGATWRAVRAAMRDAERAALGVLRHNSRLCPRCAYPLRPARNAAGWCPECGLNSPITNPGAR